MTLKQRRNLAIGAFVLLIVSTSWTHYFLESHLHAAAAINKPGLVRTNQPPPVQPVALQSTNAAAVPPTNALPMMQRLGASRGRIPVYVIPELIVIDAGGTLFQCVDPIHVNELAKLFRAYRQTNVVLWIDAP